MSTTARLAVALLTGASLLAAAAPARAAQLTVDAPSDRNCRTADAPGAAATMYTPARDGVLTTTLDAAAGDWDLTLIDRATGRRLATSATGDATERLETPLPAGREVVAVACRRSGPSRTATVGFDHHATALAAPDGTGARIVHVDLSGHGELERLEATGLDVTHNADALGADVAVYSDGDEAKLRRLGLTPTLVDDLGRSARQRRRAATTLPSGQADYRVLSDYQEQLKQLVDGHPGLARKVVIGKSVNGTDLEGVELASQVDRTDDGRPTLLLLGVHHAREWPSGEMPMEFALDLARNYGSDARITNLLDRVRVVAIPVMNPDGFAISRTAGEAELNPDDPIASLPLALTDAGPYKRKNCTAPNPALQAIPCMARPAGFGVDLNRNYGAYFGGTGSTGTDPTAQNYRGTGPYSEPESEAVHRLSSTRGIMTVISHHTFTDEGTWLRQPGFCTTNGGACDAAVNIVPDEAGMKALGDAMAQASGWLSQLGWAIGQITGATEDWNYFATGAFGYTPEQKGSNFHANYQTTVVDQYVGTGEVAGLGVRESLLRAAEQAADPTFHSVIQGRAPVGRRLRLTKAFETPTSIDGLVVEDALDFTLDVPAGGAYRWAVNPSTRPLSTAPEAYTLTCEAPDGTVLETREVAVERGRSTTVDLACGETTPPPAEESPTPQPSASPDPSPTQTATPDPSPTATATATPGTTTDDPAAGTAGTTAASTTPSPAPSPRTVTRPSGADRAPATGRSAGRPGIRVLRGALSVTRRTFRVQLRLTGATLRNVKVTLVDARGRTLATGRATSLKPGRRNVRMTRTKRAARAGTGRVKVAATVAETGRRFTATRRVTLR